MNLLRALNMIVYHGILNAVTVIEKETTGSDRYPCLTKGVKLLPLNGIVSNASSLRSWGAKQPCLPIQPMMCGDAFPQMQRS